jgi:2-haloacid dehalogenase
VVSAREVAVDVAAGPPDSSIRGRLYAWKTRKDGPVTTTPPASTKVPRTVVFDLGGVLIDWNPRYLYRRLLPDEAAVERFLAEVCTPEWNHRLDAGAPWRDYIEAMMAAHPDEAELVEAFDVRWEEMLGGAFEETVALVEELDAAGVPLYALTNWSAEKFRVARGHFPFLDRFRAIVVSGEEGVAKPDPAIFRILLERHAIEPAETVFIDDWDANIATAGGLGLRTIHFRDAESLREDLAALGLPVRTNGAVERSEASA